MNGSDPGEELAPPPKGDRLQPLVVAALGLALPIRKFGLFGRAAIVPFIGMFAISLASWNLEFGGG
ncbi:MAG: hypothetical protein AAGL49_14505, partial [Pseudomonadota bacterium]